VDVTDTELEAVEPSSEPEDRRPPSPQEISEVQTIEERGLVERDSRDEGTEPSLDIVEEARGHEVGLDESPRELRSELVKQERRNIMRMIRKVGVVSILPKTQLPQQQRGEVVCFRDGGDRTEPLLQLNPPKKRWSEANYTDQHPHSPRSRVSRAEVDPQEETQEGVEQYTDRTAVETDEDTNEEVDDGATETADQAIPEELHPLPVVSSGPETPFITPLAVVSQCGTRKSVRLLLQKQAELTRAAESATSKDGIYPINSLQDEVVSEILASSGFIPGQAASRWLSAKSEGERPMHNVSSFLECKGVV